MNHAVRDTARDWLAGGRAAVVVEVLGFKGSVPRETGTRMLVCASDVIGTIGGGHLELQAIDRARALLGSGEPGPRQQDIALGPTLGQCCGGTLTLRYALLDADTLTSWPGGGPRFELQLYGAGHVGRAIVALLAGIDCRVRWIDQREDQFPSRREPPHVERLCVEPVERRKMHVGDVDFRMFRRGADIEKVELFALLKAVVELAWTDGSHNSFFTVIYWVPC